MKKSPSLDNPLRALIQIAADLREPKNGCPWDIKQTHHSVTANLIEEAYEVLDAIKELDEKKIETYENLKEELGDLLFQVIFHAQMANEKKLFNFQDIALYICEKLIFRHPHVYSSEIDLSTETEVLKNWEKLKLEEKKKKGDEKPSMLSGIPNHMPALLKSCRLGAKAARVDFDWPKTKEGLKSLKMKVVEEIDELLVELPDDSSHFDIEPNKPEPKKEKLKKKAEEEIGDVLFAVSQLARHYHIDPEEALQKSNKKFQDRFNIMEDKFRDKLSKGKHPTFNEWEDAWQEAKEKLKQD
ncbi:MAG: nucleoside triphosphate pyrophosphohydrolase [Spirochaetia bacterium]|nr:nucleoside triphosphate pyrophosphohydrolase [Spirochaetia bacterium]